MKFNIVTSILMPRPNLYALAKSRTGISEDEWHAMINFTHLCKYEYDADLARKTARELTPWLYDKTTVLLGSGVARCFPSTGMLAQWAKPQGTPPRISPPWIHIPDPDSMDFGWYTNPNNVGAVEILLADLIELCREGNVI